MESIGEPCGIVLGSLSRVILLDVKDAVSISPKNSNYIVDQSIVLKEGKSLAEIGMKMNSASFEELGKKTKHGMLYNQKINLSSILVNPDIQLWKRQNAHKRFVMILVDNNKQVYLIGSLDFGLQLSTKSFSGNQSKSMYATDFEFVGKSVEPMAFYLMTEVLEGLPNRRVFSNSFSFAFA